MGEEILGESKGAEDAPEVEAAPATVLTGEEASTEESSEVAASADHKDGDTDDVSKDNKVDEDRDGEALTEYKFDLPEGVMLDKAMMNEFTPKLMAMNATQEQAQELVNLLIQRDQQAFEAQNKAWTDTQSEWINAAKNDEEYGKGKFDASVNIARRAMRELGGPDLEQTLAETGMGNHPEFIRVFYRIGKAIGEDNVNFGNIGQAAPKSHAERMFPNQGK